MNPYRHWKVLLVYHSEATPPEETKLFNSFKKICPDTTLLFTVEKRASRFRLIERIFNKIKIPLDVSDTNGRIKKWAEAQRPDVVFIVKGELIHPSTLLFLKKLGCRLVSWSNDDMFAWHGRSLYYTLGLRHYDLVVTQKSYNCAAGELPALGARRVLFQNKAYDPALHFPCEDAMPSETAHDVIFIGAYERDRFEKLMYLAENGIVVHIYGWGRKGPALHPNLVVHDRYLYGHEFRCAFTHSKICLNFLRKINRDLQTSRSIEIPACRGFMLAERTDEHLNLFREGVEAEFFGDADELLEKVRFYLKNEQARAQIAQRSYERCLRDGYDFDERVREIMEVLSETESNSR